MDFNLSEMKTAKAAVIEKLTKAGIITTNQLLNAGGSAEGRKELAAKIGVKAEEILELVNRADLARIKGIGPVFSDLLEYSGVDTVVELSKRVPANLFAKLTEMADKHSTQRKPRADEVQSWIDQATKLDRRVSH